MQIVVVSYFFTFTYFRIFEMERYKCHRCAVGYCTLSEIIQHCTWCHPKDTIKYRELVLDDVSGHTGYMSKEFKDIVPEDLKKKNKSVTTKDDIVIIQDKASLGLYNYVP